MLYPDLNDLMALKNRKSKLVPPSNRLAKSNLSGNYTSPFRGQGMEFDSVREYVLGDDIRNIDWRVTARTGSPHLKLFQIERERQVIICVDMNASMRFGTKNTFKSIQAARAAAILGWQALDQNDRVSACLFGDVVQGLQYLPPKRSRQSLFNLFKTLAHPPIEHHQVMIKDTLEHVIQKAHAGSLIYVISDFMEISKTPQYEKVLRRLGHGFETVFISINDAADKTLFPVGILGCSANQTEKLYINTDSIAGIKAYEAQWSENREHLYEMTSRSKIPLIELTTQSDIHRDLIFELKNRAKRKKR
jgi:uncharacterized protein (DUF58 family)